MVGSEGTVATCDGGNLQPVSTTGGVTTATCSFAAGLLGKALYYTGLSHAEGPQLHGTDRHVDPADRQVADEHHDQATARVSARGQAFTFSVVVRDVAPGTGSPTGSMEFAVCPYYASTCTGAPGGVFQMQPPTAWDVAHNQNRFTFSLPSGVLTPGFYDVSADYVGDSNYWSSQSSFSYLLVTKVPTTMSLVLSDNPTYSGGREILRAAIKGDSRATESLGGPTGRSPSPSPGSPVTPWFVRSPGPP